MILNKWNKNIVFMMPPNFSSALLDRDVRRLEIDPLTIESKKAATVVLMLNSPEEEILAKACEAIYRFALKGLDFFHLSFYFISFLKYLLHNGHFSP